MNETRLRQLLRDAPVPDEHQAEERGWRVVRAALEGRQPSRPPAMGRRWMIAIAVGLLILAIGLSPAGARVADLFKNVTGIGEKHAKPALTSLPAPGRLLVSSARGPWIVSEDGSKRLLGDYHDATWSPHGLYVAVTRARELTAVTPTGTVRWSLASDHPVADPAWAPSGFRIAYVSGHSMRVVAGDGSGDRLLARHVAHAAAAWKPLSPAGSARLTKGFGAEPIAYADAAGRIHLVDADTRHAFWISPPGPVPHELLWTPDGRELVAVARSSLRIFEEYGSPARTVHLVPGRRAAAAAVAPSGRLLALVESQAARSAGGRTQIELLRLHRNRVSKYQRFPYPGRFTGVAFSPDGGWLLLAWRDADQWLFVPSSRGKIQAVSNIAHQFAPGAKGPATFPRIEGWCCTATGAG